MLHYLAEVMTRTEIAEDAEKTVAERECFEIILRFWKHRASLPGPRRPMASFESIVQTLDQLFEDRHVVYFGPGDGHSIDPDSKEWLSLATNIDHAARDLIRWCIAMASSEAMEKDGTWVEDETARKLDDGPNLTAARMLIEKTEPLSYIVKGLHPEKEANELMKMRNRLDELVRMSEAMRDRIDAVLGSNSP
uniref:Uncharacterized protein n=1 Tax=Candidatus Kentrum sp. DK TaxID=2126562 RepID=A0A450RTG7_9GAMM|nr:MAG: hypothetical protein BECKDK2373B_GA0170837_100166 [Candidatus Kentron sp. DK]VFJ48094.1 MAG: hypothetical protein BECKDK2373C_GA0170839_10206 [Candidatus Kentron sp. DK]